MQLFAVGTEPIGISFGRFEFTIVGVKRQFFHQRRTAVEADFPNLPLKDFHQNGEKKWGLGAGANEDHAVGIAIDPQILSQQEGTQREPHHVQRQTGEPFLQHHAKIVHIPNGVIPSGCTKGGGIIHGRIFAVSSQIKASYNNAVQGQLFSHFNKSTDMACHAVGDLKHHTGQRFR